MDPREEAALFDFRELQQADARAGRRHPLSEYLARFPDHEGAIAREWVAMQAAGAGTAPAGEAPTASEGDTCIGPYRLVRRIGSGGQGTVFLAEDTRLRGRLVALKVLDVPASALSTARIERLRREAAALARLSHPGICAMLDVELCGSPSYLAMQFLPGQTLQSTLAAAAAPPRSAGEIVRVLQWVERTALAAHAAHEAGIVHRDIKPANIMLDADGLPVLLDFGLARDEDGDSQVLTMSGEVFGTLAYMAPEQLAGRRDLDRRVDVYALGVTLYECLTGSRPFAATSREALVSAIQAGGCPDVRTRNTAVSRDLAIVVATAMEIARERRYATAREFADDLANVRERRPIRARAAGIPLRLWRWTQRHPVVATALVLFAAAFVAVSVMSVELRAQMRDLSAWTAVNRATSLAARDPGRALDLATAAAEGQEEYEIRSELAKVLACNWQTYEIERRNPADPGDDSQYPVLLGDRATLASITTKGTLLLARLADGKVVRSIPGVIAASNGRITLANEGRLLVLADQDGGLRTLEAAALSAGQLRGETFGDDHRYLASVAAASGAPEFFAGGDGGRIERFRLRADGTVQERLPLAGCDGELVEELWPHPAARMLLAHASASNGPGERRRTFVLVDLARSAVAARWSVAHSKGLCAAWSDDGERLAMVDVQAGALRVLDSSGVVRWERAEGEQVNAVRWIRGCVVTFGQRGIVVRDAATAEERRIVPRPLGRDYQDGWLAPDGGLIAVSNRDGTVRVFDTASWECAAYLGCTVEGYAMRGYWGDGGRFAFADFRTIQGFTLGSRPWLSGALGRGDAVVGLGYHPDGTRLAWATRSGAVHALDVRDGSRQRLGSVSEHATRVRTDGTNVVVAAGDAAYVLSWSGDVCTPLRGHGQAVTELLAAPAAQQFVTVSRDGTAKAWSRHGELIRTFATPGGELVVGAVDEALDRLAVGGIERCVYVFRLSTGELLRTLARPAAARQFLDGRPTCLSFDAKHDRLWAAALDGHDVGAWDLGDFAFHESGGLGLGSTGWAITDPRGRWLFAAEQAVGSCAWFDANDLTRLPWNPKWEPGTRISRAQFSPSGEHLMVASLDGTVRVFAMDALAPWAVFTAGNSAVVDACWSPDGRGIAAGHEDGSVVVWPLDPLPVARAHLVRRQSR